MSTTTPKPTPIPGSCQVCGRDRDVFVCSSSLAAMSVSICQECVVNGAEYTPAVDVTLWNGFQEDGSFSAAAFDPSFLECYSVYYKDRYMLVSDYIQQEGVLDSIKAQIDDYNTYCKTCLDAFEKAEVVPKESS